MKMFKFLLLCITALLVSCASTGGGAPSQKTQLAVAYDTVTAYIEVMNAGAQRGKVTAPQLEKAISNAKLVKSSLDTATATLASCATTPGVNCDRYIFLLQSLQPALLQMEQDLKKAQLEGVR